MGPEGGDEFNLIEKGQNYGYPIVSDGDHYDGRDIPDHETRPEFAEPKITWTPVVSPAGLIVYWGHMFPAWRGDSLMGGLSVQATLRIDLGAARAQVGARWDIVPLFGEERQRRREPSCQYWGSGIARGGRTAQLSGTGRL